MTKKSVLKAFSISVIGLFFFSLFMIPRASAQSTQNFTIQSFDADYYLDKGSQQQSTMRVVEKIVAKFPDYDQNHGILRAIPETYQGNSLSLSIQSVTDGNTAWPYSKSHQNGNLVLKIGDGNRYVHGLQTYIITYNMKNVAGLYKDHDELYWNVNGNQWPQTFGPVTARLHIAESVATNLLDGSKCYSGAYGSTDDSSCTISTTSVDGGGKLITAQVAGLKPYQTLTFVAGFKAGTFVLGPEVHQAELRHALAVIGIFSSVIGIPIIAALWLYRKWKKFGDDPKGRGVIIPEYQPPQYLSVMSSDFILKENLRVEAMSAQIIDMAIRRYINIYETEKNKLIGKAKEYDLELIKDPSDLPEEARRLANALFGNAAPTGTKTKLSELKNKLYTEVKNTGTFMSQDMTERGYFARNPRKVHSTYVAWGVALIVAGFVLLSIFVGIGLILAGLVTLAFARIMPARTTEGVTQLEYLRGLKLYIGMAEAERLRFLQSPDGAEKIKATGFDPSDEKVRVKLFESLLPYAMIFGMEKDWAKQFANIYQQPPEWYSGNWTAFNVGYLASSLGSFSQASAATFAAPSSSSSSGFGGGFSGGGGGGGGGGGW